jgi:hypothetical protein
MSPLPRHILPVIALALLILAPGHARAQAKISVPDVFSYDIPPGWSREDIPNMYPAAVELTGPGDAAQAKAMISVTSKTSNAKLSNWCADAMARNQKQFASLGAQVGPLQPFTTTAGIAGYRATIDLAARGRQLHYVMYFFDGGSGAKITITCACPAADIAHYAPLFEAAMKTYAPK